MLPPPMASSSSQFASRWESTIPCRINLIKMEACKTVRTHFGPPCIFLQAPLLRFALSFVRHGQGEARGNEVGRLCAKRGRRIRFKNLLRISLRQRFSTRVAAGAQLSRLWLVTSLIGVSNDSRQAGAC